MLTKLRTTREELIKSVMELTEEQFNLKPASDKWSAAQVLHHLYTSEKGTVKSLRKNLVLESEAAEDKDFSFISDRSRKVKTQNEPPEDFFNKEDVCALLLESRESLEKLVEETGEATFSEKSIDHPAFGRMNLKNMVEFIGLHEKRHMDQIEEIKKEIL
jgi:uncharacterized damage-inducible protein DinB